MEPLDTVTLPRVFAGGVLRRLAGTDLSAFQAYRAHPDLNRYQGWSPMPRDEAAAFLSEMGSAPLFARGAWVQLGIAEPESQCLIGDIGLFLSGDGGHAEIGFTLEPQSQGHGIATAAVREAIKLMFEATSVQQVRGITDARNTASVRLLERVGMRRVETRRSVFRGESCIEYVYAVGRSDG